MEDKEEEEGVKQEKDLSEKREGEYTQFEIVREKTAKKKIEFDDTESRAFAASAAALYVSRLALLFFSTALIPAPLPLSFLPLLFLPLFLPLITLPRTNRLRLQS